MTPKELYEWAKENFAENCQIKWFSEPDEAYYEISPSIQEQGDERFISV